MSRFKEDDHMDLEIAIQMLGKQMDKVQAEPGNHNALLQEMRAVIDAAALQVPVKPVGRATQMHCGYCHRRIRSGRGSSSYTRDRWCNSCGTKIDWGDE